MQSLFPTNIQHNAAPALVSFKAGKCNMTRQPNGKFNVTADTRKGTLALVTGNDGLLHFQWTDRSSNIVVDNFIMMANEATFTKVNTGRENDRVYLLKWNNSTRRMMYWMQTKDPKNDTDNVKKVADTLAAPPQAAGADNSQMDLFRMLGLAPPAAGAAPAARPPQPPAAQRPAVPNTSNLFNDLDFGSLLAGQSLPIIPPVPSMGGSIGNEVAGNENPMPSGIPQLSSEPPSSSSATQQTTPTRLLDVLQSDAIINSGILNKPEVQQRLMELLPESQRTPEGLLQNIRSPQFQQSVNALAEALHSDNFHAIMASFGIDPSPGIGKLMQGDPVGAFIACILAEADRERRSHSSSGGSSTGASNSMQQG
jgi:hypothetical protein